MSYQLNEKVKIFSLDSNPKLAEEIVSHLNWTLGKSSVAKFSDGEIQVHIEESVRGCDVYVVQSTSQPVNERVMELLIMIDALKRASAKTINVVIPYYGYARQDRKARSREPVTAKLIANLLEKAGAHRLITLDLHTAQIQGFFDIPVEQLQGTPVLGEYFEQKNLTDVVVVAPHNNGMVRARKVAGRLNVPIALVDKRRPEAGAPEEIDVIGDVEGKTAIIIDDLIDTGRTMAAAVKALTSKGAKEVYAGCTHAVLSVQAMDRIKQSSLKELVVTNTISVPAEKQLSNITVLSVAPLLADTINRVHNELTVSVLFDES